MHTCRKRREGGRESLIKDLVDDVVKKMRKKKREGRWKGRRRGGRQTRKKRTRGREREMRQSEEDEGERAEKGAAGKMRGTGNEGKKRGMTDFAIVPLLARGYTIMGALGHPRHSPFLFRSFFYPFPLLPSFRGRRR